MKIPTLKDEWIGLAEDIFYGDEPEYQYVEMQKSFYAGALAVVNIMIRVANSEMPAKKGADVIKSLREEIIKFRETIE